MMHLEGSYRECERIARESGSNFYRSFAFLRYDRRRAMNALYAFSRLADDATDAASPTVPWQPEHWLAWLRLVRDSERSACDDFEIPLSLQPIGPALADSIHDFHIPVEMLSEIVRGVAMDTAPHEIKTWQDLRTYGFRVASAVGICCIAIWTSGNPPTPRDPVWRSAVDCGLAFQLTNILRDLREDAVRGRCYLPSSELSFYGIDRNQWIDVLSGKTSRDANAVGNWNGLLEVQFERAHALFERGWSVIQFLEPDGQRMFSLMWHTYRELLSTLEKNPRQILASSPKLSIARKARLVATHVFSPSFIRLVKKNSRLLLAPYAASNSEQLVAPKSSSEEPRVAVIGGGLAGINAALHLARHGCRVTLMEARSRLGGRAGSFVDPQSGAHIDYCQHIGMKCCSELRHWIARTGQQHAWKTEDTLHFVSRSGKRIAVKGWPIPAPFHLSGLILAWPDLTLTDRIRIAMGLAALLRSKSSDVFDRQPALEWLKSHYQNEQTIRSFWATILVSALGEQIDRVAMGPVRKVLVDGFAKTQDAYHLLVPKQPLSQLVDQASRATLAKMQVDVRCASTTSNIERTPSGSWKLSPPQFQHPISSSDENGTQPKDTFRFDALVVAVPWHRLANLLPSSASNSDADPPSESPCDPYGSLRAAGELDASPITGVHTWWDRPWLDRQHAIVIDHLCQWVFPGPKEDFQTSQSAPASPSDRREYYYQVVISGSRDLPRGDAASVLKSVQKDLAEVLPESAVSSLIRGRVVTDPQSVFSVAPGHEASRLRQDCAGDDGLFLAGDWTDTGWPATMEGALRSGLLAAEGALAYLQRPARLLK